MWAKAYCTQLSVRDLGPEVHEKMFQSGGQSDAKTPVLNSQACLVLIYRPTERMSRSCPARDLNLGSLFSKRDALTTKARILLLIMLNG
ncbi:hypothetical protein TNCV_508141 [Trichonephila clavipes]|nr:hypothetical protein TNCV_508141 [Trichonephila clavipes]